MSCDLIVKFRDLLSVDDVIHVGHAVVRHHGREWENAQHSLLATVGRPDFVGVDV